MKVSDLAQDLKTTPEAVLDALKSLKLKSQNKNQELSAAVISVVRRHFANIKDAPKKIEKKENASEKEAASSKKTPVKKRVSKKKTVEEEKPKEKETSKEDKPAAKKKIIKKHVIKRVVKKSVKKEEAVVKQEPQEKQESAAAKPKKVISDEPVITLKPLSKKRRKQPKDEKAGLKVVEDASDGSQEFAIQQEESVKSEEREIKELLEKDTLPEIEIQVPISVKDLSVRLQQKPSAVLMTLMQMGVMANINQDLDGEIVSRIAQKHGFKLAKIKTKEEQLINEHKEEEEDPKLLKPRAPVVTLMGHVDHGKTTLLDYIRKSKVASSEHGGITQHMGAYSVETKSGRITFLDTPGHEAFTAMRARGAHITDLVILVVAADEGIMPQTIEAIDHARAADVPIIVALTKIDRQHINTDRVKKQLAELNLASEDWGGKTVVVGVSAVTGEGVDNLLEMILLETELLELRANPNKLASGIVVEAHLSQGKGTVATLIVQSGTLRKDDYIIVGPYYGKIKAMFNDRKQTMNEAGPSMPIEVLGLSDVPVAGESFYGVESEKKAREITMTRQQQLKSERLRANQKITLEDLYSQIQEGSVKELNVIIKSDVQGSLEALKDSLDKLPKDKVKLKFIHLGVGDVNTSDILLAVASKAIIIAFHVSVESRARQELEKDPVDIREYKIIYDVVDDMRKALEGMLDAKTKKNFISRIEIRQVFKLSRSGVIAGCFVLKGKVHRKANIDILREDKIIHSGKISSLKRFKDDVKEVTEGMECGISIESFNEIQEGDIIEAYEIERISQKL